MSKSLQLILGIVAGLIISLFVGWFLMNTTLFDFFEGFNLLFGILSIFVIPIIGFFTFRKRYLYFGIGLLIGPVVLSLVVMLFLGGLDFSGFGRMT